MASAHGFTRRIGFDEQRALVPAPLALPAPPGHVPQPLPSPRRRRSALPTLWAALAASLLGFVSASALIERSGLDGGVVASLPLGGGGAATFTALRETLARLVIPAAAPPPRSLMPPDVRAAGLVPPTARDDASASIAGLVEALNAPVIDVGPFGEPLPPAALPPTATLETAPLAPATLATAESKATWTGMIGADPVVAALPPAAALQPSEPEVDDEGDEGPALGGAAPRPPPAAPRLRAAEPRVPRIIGRPEAASPAGGGARVVQPPPAARRSAAVGASIPLPPLPEPRAVGVARPVPPPDGFASQAATTAPAGGAPFMRFARPFDPADQRPRIAIVVVDLGLTPAPTDHAIHYLPGPVTLAFSPFADGLPRWIELARKAGHEVLLQLPLESPVEAAAGPSGTPAIAGAGAENLGRLDWALGRATGYVGVASFLAIAGGEPALRPILANLRERGVLYVDRQSGPRTAGARLAGELGVPRAGADREIDADPSREAIDQRLIELERLARDTGTAVAIARPLPLSYERLATWSTTLESKGIALAPITAVLNRQRNR